MDVQVSHEAGAGCDHSKLRNYFSNAAISTNQPIENRKLGRTEYTILKVANKGRDGYISPFFCI